MKKQFLRMVSVLVVVAALLSLASCKSGGQSTLRQEFVDNGKNQPYSQNVPLQEMDFDIYFKDIINKMGNAAVEINDNRKIVLSNDIEYFENKNDREPALVLKKGTTIYIHDLRSGIMEGYGLWAWPDYEAGWRYGKPLADNYTDIRTTSIAKSYFVKLEQLALAADDYYNQNDCFNRYSPEEFRKGHLLFMDKILYLEGAFCSPDLEANYSRRDELSG